MATAGKPRNDAPTYSTQQVRQGDIILRTPVQRGIFIAGIAGAAILVFVLALAGAQML
jgi:hypothetical protein